MGKKEKPLGIILVGAGRIGKLHAHNVANRLPGFALEAIVEPYPDDEIGPWAGEQNVQIFETLDKAIGTVNAEAVLIAAPTDQHEPTAVTAAEAGLHVFCEKPVAPDIPAARRVIDAATKAGVVLQIGFNRRFDHNFAALRGTVVEGRLGKVEMIRVTSRDPGPPAIDYIRRSGGLFMDMTIHDFDMARFLSGDEIVEVHARGTSVVDQEIGKAGDIDTALISFATRSGAIGLIENSRRAAYGYDQRAEILGSAGAAAIENDTPSTLVISDAEGVHTEKPLYFFLERYDRSFVSELECFGESIRGGSDAAVSGTDGLEAMRIAQACRLSLAEGRPVALEEIV